MKIGYETVTKVIIELDPREAHWLHKLTQNALTGDEEGWEKELRQKIFEGTYVYTIEPNKSIDT